MIDVDRTEGEDGLGENGVPVNGLHPACFEKSFVSLDVVSTQIGDRLCRGVLAQICEKPEIGLEVLLDRAPCAERTTKLGLPAQSPCKREGEGSRMDAGEINLKRPAIARLYVEAQTEHPIADVRGNNAIGWRKTHRGSLAWAPRHSVVSEGSNPKSSSTAASTVSARAAMWSR